MKNVIFFTIYIVFFAICSSLIFSILYMQFEEQPMLALNKAIKYGGSSINDYVSPDGTLGNFQNKFNVYGQEGLKIKGYKIKKEVLYGRSTFFCPEIQK